jgi:hypothetical protein
MEQIEKVGEDGATMAVSVNEGALQCDYSITTAWATAAADYVFDEATDMSQTPFLTFRLKGNGTNTALRIVCKNMSAGHEDWWYTEKITLSKNTWQDIALDLRTLQSFDWYGNTDEKNHLEGIVRISFGVSTGSAVNGTFYLDYIIQITYPCIILALTPSFSTPPLQKYSSVIGLSNFILSRISLGRHQCRIEYE